MTSIEQAMKDCHIALRPNRNSKQQALDAIRKLKEGGLKIQRARMRLSVSVSKKAAFDKIRPLAFRIESENFDEANHVLHSVLLCDPGDYRQIDEIITSQNSGTDKSGLPMIAKLEIVDLHVTVEEDEEEDRLASVNANESNRKNKKSMSETEPEENPTGASKSGGKKKGQQKKKDDLFDDSDEEFRSGGKKKGQRGPAPLDDDHTTASSGRGGRKGKKKFADFPDDD